ncbi:hypothetical protein HJG60_010058 [Phyllostomus discolor]|uniref:Uncharacterized protein n=1 Tax=Phyllostomus discolor TaxID=89673 RepID=A0A834ARY2_9CHIR|nr:hypothetical protein HJG60_010058 [Phyllostomus discolor]
MPLPPGLLRTAGSPHCPLGSVSLRALLDRALPSCSLPGSGAPRFLPRPSEQNLGRGTVCCWGSSLTLHRGILSLYLSDQLPEDTALEGGGRRAGACAEGPGPRATRDLASSSSGPLAHHLFCALVTHESSHSPGLRSAPDAPLFSCWHSEGPTVLGQVPSGLGGGWGRPSPALAHCPPLHGVRPWSFPGPEPPCRPGSLSAGNACVYRLGVPSPGGIWAGAACTTRGRDRLSEEGPDCGSGTPLWHLSPSSHAWSELCRGSSGGSVPVILPGSWPLRPSQPAPWRDSSLLGRCQRPALGPCLVGLASQYRAAGCCRLSEKALCLSPLPPLPPSNQFP